MRLAAVPVCRIAPSNVPCFLPPTRQPVVATEAFLFMYKVVLFIKDFHDEELAQACIFSKEERALNSIKSRLGDYLVLDASTFIQVK